MKAAVIGVGSMGRHHARVYSELPDVTLVGLADASAEVGGALAARYGVPAFTDHRELLEQTRPELVSVAVPTTEHFRVASDAIAAGANLLVEKPIAASTEEGQSLLAAAEAAGVTLAVGHIERHNPAVTALRAHLDSGELGQLFQLRAYRLGPFPARIRDVGVIIDLATHDLDIMRYVSGDEIVRVFAETKQQIHTLREDLLTGLVRFACGATGTLEINWLTPTKIRQLAVTGERGMFVIDYLTQDLTFFENAQAEETGWDRLAVLRGVSEGRMIRYVVPKMEPLRAELEDFAAAVRDGRPPKVSGQDGLAALRLAQALVESGQTGRVVSLD